MSNENLQLIIDAKNGSNYALSQLLEQNYDSVYKYLLKLTLNQQLAADIAQDTMIKVIDKFALYDYDKSALSTWMIAIARNLLSDEYRRNKLSQKHLEVIDVETGHNPFDELLERDTILAAMKILSDKLRLPLVLRFSDGFSYDEIAKILKIPVGTVKSRISNALKLLKKELVLDEE